VVCAGFVANAGIDGQRGRVGDDVVTAGATLGAARGALVMRGARHVVLAAVASTPAAVSSSASAAQVRSVVLPFRRSGGAAGASAA